MQVISLLLVAACLWAESEKISRKIAQRKGGTAIELSDDEKMRFRDAMTKVYSKYCADDMDMLSRIMEY